MSSKKYHYAYTDGGERKWAVVLRYGGGASSMEGWLPLGSTNDDTESEAILKACEFAEQTGGNWKVITDSKAIVAKVKERCVNATGQPNIAGIRSILKRVKESPKACSIEIEWKKRLSTPEMAEADEMCRGRN